MFSFAYLRVHLFLALALVPAALPAQAGERLRLATTTSTENSGLLAQLLPPFEAAHGVRVDVIAVGTGRALKLGEQGDVDLVLVHSRAAEDDFVAAGHGVHRKDVMANSFVILGPPGDPAKADREPTAARALARIMAAGANFVSRGDDSGTHRKERALWVDAGLEPGGPGYLEAGQGMGPVLILASEKRAYTLSDRGTWLAMRARLDLAVAFEGDPILFNPYGIIAVNPARHPKVNHKLARELIDYVVGPRGQAIIRDFQVGGEPLFLPVIP